MPKQLSYQPPKVSMMPGCFLSDLENIFITKWQSLNLQLYM